MLVGDLPYIEPADLLNYLPSSAVNLGTNAEQLQACIDASETADSYLRGRYSLPMQAVGNDVKRYVGYIAIFLLLSGPVGFAPEAGSDSNVTRNYYSAVGWPDRPGSGWFPGVERQSIHPDVTPSVPVGQDPMHDQPQVRSQPLRGWQQLNARGRPVVS